MGQYPKCALCIFGNGKYCTDYCQKPENLRRLEKKCPACGKWARFRNDYCEDCEPHLDFKISTPKDKKTRRCVVCNKLLIARHKYCSDKCQQQANQRKTPKKFCATCNILLINRQRKYCSDECQKRARQNKKPQRFCLVCGIPLTGRRYKYCSDKCREPIRTKKRTRQSLLQEYNNQQWLAEHYIQKELGYTEIAQTVGVESGTIKNWLVNFGIPLRPTNYKQIPKETLKQYYIKQKMSQIEIGKILGFHAGTIRKALRHYGISIRSKAETNHLQYNKLRNNNDIPNWVEDVPISGGIYAITNLVDGKSTTYTGSTTQSLRDRWKVHLYNLRHGKHHNSHLQRAWNKYGEEAFEFSVLQIIEEIDYDTLIEQEQVWLDIHRKKGPTYNKSDIAASPQFGRRKKRSYPTLYNTETGQTIPLGDDLHTLCDQKQLSYGLMRRVVERKQYHHKHWVLADESLRPPKKERKRKKYAYPALYNYETDETIPAGEDLYILCKQRELNYSSMLSVCRKSQYRHRGWMLRENKDKSLPPITGGMLKITAKPYPSFYNLETGEIIPPSINLSELCRKKKLNVNGMNKVKLGQIDSYKNWILLERKGELVQVWEDKKKKAGYPTLYNLETHEIIEAGENLVLLCQKRGFNAGNMRLLKQGKLNRYRGWVLYSQKNQKIPRQYPSFYNIYTEEIIPTGINLSELCRKRNLTRSCMADVVGGKRKQHRGWILLEKMGEYIKANDSAKTTT